MLFDNDVKLKAQAALKRYLEGDYPDHVKNPILLLNYLNQHAIIPRPNYNTISSPDNAQHAVSCKIGNTEIIANGNTVKVARIRAAKLFLERLLDTSDTSDTSNTSNMNNTVKTSMNGNSTESFWSNDVPFSFSFDNSNANSGDFIQSHSWDEPLNYDYYSMENGVSSEVSESFSPYQNTDGVDHQPTIEVQCGSSEQNNGKSNSSEDTLNLNFHKDRSHPVSSNPIILEPQCGPDQPVSFINLLHTQPHPITNEKIIQIEPQCDQLPKHDENPSPKSSADMFAENLNQTPLHFDQYFDPFFKQRPSNSNDQHFDPFVKQIPSNSNYIMETENVTNNVPENEQKPVNDTVEPSNSNANGKNVFAALQKKTQKHMKLIPRFRIENTETGFKCTVRLGKYFAQGEGRNKKEAKTNAAVCLLEQMKDYD